MGAVVSVVGIALLVPILGFMGAALSTVACYAVMAIICYLYGQKYYPIPYQTRSGLGYLVLAFTLSCGGFYVQTEDIYLDFLIKNSGAFIFLGVVLLRERKFFTSLLEKKS
jgi:O-antigen/teichoic acid export membrane protein